MIIKDYPIKVNTLRHKFISIRDDEIINAFGESRVPNYLPNSDLTYN